MAGVVFASTLTAAVSGPELVKDIRLDTGSSGLLPRMIRPADTQVFFVADALLTGEELWVTNGTQAGTRLVKDIRPGGLGSDITEMVTVGKKAFFVADDGTSGRELWVSDGTEAGTRLVVDLNPDGDANGHRWNMGLKPFRGGVAFLASADSSWAVLWTDGTASGTRIVHRLNTINSPVWQSLGVLGQYLYFMNMDAAGQNPVLMKTSGTAAGTVPVAPLQVEGFDRQASDFLGQAGSYLYFRAWTPGTGMELWKTNGTAAGTSLVRDITPGTEDSEFSQFVTLGSQAAFLVKPKTGSRYEVWVTDGGSGGTFRIHDGIPEGQSLDSLHLAAVAGSLQVGYNIGTEGKLWTWNPKTRAEAFIDLGGNSVKKLTSAGDWGYVGLRTAGGQPSILYTGKNGFASLFITPVDMGVYWNAGDDFITAGKDLYFGGQAGGGAAFWKTDFKTMTLSRIDTPLSGGLGSLPQDLHATSTGLYFTASSAGHGREVWHSDGTEAGTHLLKELSPGSTFSDVRFFVEADGVTWFFHHNERGVDVWRTDGTEAGTTRVYTATSSGLQAVQQVASLGSRIYFTGRDNEKGLELWGSTPEGQIARIADLNSNPTNASSNPSWYTEMDERLYFTAEVSSNNHRLYAINSMGGLATVAMGFETISHLTVGLSATTVSGKRLYFLARKPGETAGLYYLENGVVTLVKKDFGAQVSLIGLWDAGNQVIFQTTPSGTSYPASSIWTSNGSSTMSLHTQHLIQVQCVAGGKVFYTHEFNNTTSLQVFNLQGGGDPMLMTLYDGFQLVHIEGDAVYFSQTVGGKRLLYQSRGTPETTVEIPGAYSMGPVSMAALGQRLYFNAARPDVREELFALDARPRLEVSMENPDGSGKRIPLTEGSTLTLNPNFPGNPSYLAVYLRNTGLKPLTGLAVSTQAPFSVTPPLAEELPFTTLAAGEERAVMVRFTPVAAGASAGTLQITGMAEAAFTLSLNLKGTGVELDAKIKPFILNTPAPVLMLEGDTSWLTRSDIRSTREITRTFWKRGSTVVSEDPDYLVDKAGLYTLNVTSSAGTTTGNPIPVVTLGATPETLVMKEGSTLALKFAVNAPAGSQLSYQWTRGGTPLSDFDRVSGSRTPSLRITNLDGLDTNYYTCEVTLRSGGYVLTTSIAGTSVEILTKPNFLTGTPDPAYVGQGVSHVFVVENADRLTVRGLPPGLTMDETGQVTGSAKVSREAPYMVTLTAVNAGGTRSVTLPWTVLPPLPAGSYDGLADSPGPMPARVQLTLTAAGSASAQIHLGTKVYRIAGRPKMVNSQQGYLTVVKSSTEPRLLVIETNPIESPRSLRLSLWDGIGMIAVRHRFSTQDPNVALTGHCAWALNGSAEIGVPRGDGYLTGSAAKSGLVTWAGKLADGTAVTGSSSLLGTPADEGYLNFVMYHPLYSGRGGMYGLGDLLGSAAFNWVKEAHANPERERSYGEGFAISGGMNGGLYVPPVAGERLLGLGEGDDNALFSMPKVRWGGLTQTFTLTDKNTVRLPALDEGTFLKTLTVNAKLGTFKGTVVIKDANPDLPNRPWVRTATVEGVMLPSAYVARGFIVLPDLPNDRTEPLSSLNRTPLLSEEVSWSYVR